jgi:hypothetical protein
MHRLDGGNRRHTNAAPHGASSNSSPPIPLSPAAATSAGTAAAFRTRFVALGSIGKFVIADLRTDPAATTPSP